MWPPSAAWIDPAARPHGDPRAVEPVHQDALLDTVRKSPPVFPGGRHPLLSTGRSLRPAGHCQHAVHRADRRQPSRPSPCCWKAMPTTCACPVSAGDLLRPGLTRRGLAGEFGVAHPVAARIWFGKPLRGLAGRTSAPRKCWPRNPRAALARRNRLALAGGRHAQPRRTLCGDRAHRSPDAASGVRSTNSASLDGMAPALLWRDQTAPQLSAFDFALGRPEENFARCAGWWKSANEGLPHDTAGAGGGGGLCRSCCCWTRPGLTAWRLASHCTRCPVGVSAWPGVLAAAREYRTPARPGSPCCCTALRSSFRCWACWPPCWRCKSRCASRHCTRRYVSHMPNFSAVQRRSTERSDLRAGDARILKTGRCPLDTRLRVLVACSRCGPRRQCPAAAKPVVPTHPKTSACWPGMVDAWEKT